MRARVVTCVLLYLLGASATRTARANGRFPDAQTVVHAPSDPSTLWVRTTFGVLVTHDAGASWRWICEGALGFSGTWDPPLVATRAGSLAVALEDGLRLGGGADGCAFTTAASGARWLVTDLTSDPRGEIVVGVTSAPDGAGLFSWTPPAGAPSWTPMPAAAGLRLESVEIAPSRPTRFFVTGTPLGAGPRAHLFRGDRVATVTVAELHPKLPFDDARLFVAAIDPKDPSRVLLRAMRPDGSDVLLSTDAGQSFRSVLHVAGSLFGFAKSDDGATYWAGSGDPREGVFRSRDRGEHWESTARIRTYCLHAAGKRLFACASPFGTNGTFAIGASDDDGATFHPLLARFSDVRGPAACDTADGGTCAAAWPAQSAALAPAPSPPSSSSEADAATDAATSEPHDAGAAAGSARSRCSCTTPGAPVRPEKSNSSWAFALVLLALRGSRLHHRRTSTEPRSRPRA